MLTKIERGDPLVIYQIQPGDEVVIPSRVALESADTDGGRTVDLVATGAVELTVPGAWRMAVRLNGDGERVALEGERTEDGLTVRLSQEEVGDGRVRILLRE